MERRWTTRTKLAVDVDLAVNGEGHIVCKTSDIGLGGAYVTHAYGALPNGENVELIFRLNGSPTLEEHKIRAKVVRSTADGVGLMFRDFDAVAFRSLQKVMKIKENASTTQLQE